MGGKRTQEVLFIPKKKMGSFKTELKTEKEKVEANAAMSNSSCYI